jgi:heme a synthase
MGTKFGLHRFAVLAVIATILLIFVGGLVTSTGSGLSVPDWPLSYGKILPRTANGVAYEHGHRVAAALVGLLSVALTTWIWIVERRKWVRLLGAFALLAVICRAILGAITIWSRKAPFPTTLHVACGAATLGTCFWLTLNAYRAFMLRSPANLKARSATGSVTGQHAS